MKLTEMIMAHGRINEADQKDLPKGVLCRGSWLTCSIDELNANKRVYGREVWDKVMSDPDICEKMEKRCGFGQGEHPAETMSDLMLTSHIVTGMTIEDTIKEGKGTIQEVFSNIDILDTPTGRILNTLIEAGCQVGVSTRAEGDLEEAETEELGKHSRVVAGAYEYQALDFTADPSTFNTCPRGVQLAVANEVKTGVHTLNMNERISKNLADKLLSGMTETEVKIIRKKIAEEEDCKGNAGYCCANCGKCSRGKKADEKKEDEPKMKKGTIIAMHETTVTIRLEDGTEIETETSMLSADSMTVHMPETNPMDDMPEEDPLGGLGDELIDDEPVPDPLEDLGDNVPADDGEPDPLEDLGDEEFEDEELDDDGKPKKKKGKNPFEGKVFEGYTEMVNFLCDKFVTVPKVDMDKIRRQVQSSMFSSGPAATSAKTIRSLRISEAKTKAELEESIKICDEIAAKAPSTDRAMEIKILQRKLGEAQKAVEDDVTKSNDEALAVMAMLEKRTGQLKEIAAKIKEAKTAHEAEIEKLQKQIEEAKEATKINLIERKQKIEKTVNEKVVKSYVQLKLDHSGLKVHESARALLEKCNSVEEVDAVYEDVREGMRRGALHPEKGSDIKVTEEAKESDSTKQIKDSVTNVLSGIMKS
jgi:hypothetical protein